MKIYNGVNEFKKLNCAVVTSGTFDGVHVGHQKIISRLQEIARNNGGETVLITFWPHPRFVIDSDNDSLKLLSTFEEKASYLKKQGIEHLVKISFTKKFSQLTSEEFIKNILVEKIGTKKLVIGYDHRFGKNREGSFEHLKENAGTYGFEVEEIPRQDIDEMGVSSTKIRHALENGEIRIANEFLARQYSIAGQVVAGDQLGRQIGFPTANLLIMEKYKLIPADGVYAVEVMYKAHLYKGMLNIGFRPTVGGMSKTVEVNIFDFNKDIYGEELRIFFIEQIRKESKFENTKQLQEQLVRDRQLAKKILDQHINLS